MNCHETFDTYFNKQFAFEKTENQNISYSKLSPKWVNPKLTLLKEESLRVKSLLNDIDIQNWGVHTSKTDLSSFLLNDAKKKLGHKFGLVTRAWLKMHEMLNSFPFLNPEKMKYNICFLCEAPGAFISCLDYHIKTKNKLMDWIATSLNPYYEQHDPLNTAICDDRFINQPDVYENWLFGPDNTGDISSNCFLKWFIERSTNLKFDLVTGDAGVNCANDPSIQEEIMFPLILNQIICAINCLVDGGTFVIKFFTIFECQTICCLYILYLLFEKIIVTKPFSSKEGNSEIYLICINFKCHKDFIQYLTEASQSDHLYSLCLFRQEDISENFLLQVIECSRLFLEWQNSSILRNFRIYQLKSKEKSYRKLISLKKLLTRIYFRKYPLYYASFASEILLRSSQQMISSLCFCNLNSFLNLVIKRKSLNEREMVCKIEILDLKLALSQIKGLNNLSRFLKTWKKMEPSDLDKIKFSYGRIYKDITNSPFIEHNLLYIFNKLKVSLKSISSFSYDQANIDLRSLFLSIISNPPIIYADKLYSDGVVKDIVKFIRDLYSCEVLVVDGNGLRKSNNINNNNIQKVIILVGPHNPFHVFGYAHESEISNILTIIRQLQPMLEVITEHDILIFLIHASISRLMVGFLYFIKHFFSDLAVIPYCKDNYNLLCYIFTNQDKMKQMDLELLKNQLQNIEKELKFKQNGRLCGLVEIFNVPTLFSDKKFCEIIFAANILSTILFLTSLIQ